MRREARGRIAARRAAGRWLAWANGLAARWRSDSPWLGSPSFVWLARPRSVNRTLLRMLRVQGSSLRLHFSPVLSLRLALSRTLDARIHPGSPRPLTARAPSRGRSPRASAGLPSPVHASVTARHTRTGPQTTMPLVRDVRPERWRVRTASPVSADRTRRMPHPAARLLGRLDRDDGRIAPGSRIEVLRQAAQAGIPGRAAEHRETPRRAATTPAPPARAHAVSSPVDVEHLTEQVMRQIDRRVVAWRERMGRA